MQAQKAESFLIFIMAEIKGMINGAYAADHVG